MTGFIVPPARFDGADRAACAGADPKLFFPGSGEGVSEALKLCAKCGVQAACLSYAVTYSEPYGVWGGMTAAHRQTLIAELRRPDSKARASR